MRNDKLIQRLHRIVAGENISHAYIFEGLRNVDKKRYAMEFVKAILCPNGKGAACGNCTTCIKIDHGNHEDILFVNAEKGTVVKDREIELLQERLKIKALGERNIAVINDADLMTVRAQNRLLKILEEPPQGTVIILISNNIENLRQTVVSRCVVFRVEDVWGDNVTEALELAKEAANMLIKNRPFYSIKDKLKEVTADRLQAEAFLDALERNYRDLLVGTDGESKLYSKEYIYNAVSSIEEARRDLSSNISVGYVIKNLILKIGG